MELIPRAFVAGLFFAPPPPSPMGGGGVTRDVINRIWSEVTTLHSYQALQLAPGGDGAQFVGSSPEEAVTIQAPLLQVRDLVEYGVQPTAAKVQGIFKTASRHLGTSQFFNLGVKIVYNAPVAPAMAPDARTFVLDHLVHGDADQLAALQGGGDLWMGVKYVVTHETYNYTVAVEPLQADPTMIFIDIDAQYPGPVLLDTVAERAKDVADYVTNVLRGYLERSGSE